METLHTSLTNELVEIAGKDGGGGDGHQPVEADDTLGSRQTLRLLIAVSEGPIHSIDDVLLNNVSYTQYPDVSIETRLGTADQTVIPGFTSVETTHSPFQPTTLSAGTVQGTNPVEYITTFTHDVSAARVTMLCPSLVQATSQGDRVGYSVSYTISVRPISSSIWQTVVSDTINGKGSNISWDVRVVQPAASTGNWQIKVTRTSPDDTSDMLHSVLAVQHITDLIDSAETYPYTALIGITVKNAKLFGNTEPAVTVIAKGMTYYLPYGYDATARTYPTVWTGNFKALREYTDNPAWAIYYSITTNPDGTPLKWSRNIPRSYVDTGAFYNLAKYCDGLVPDGKGGMEPRFRIDLQYLDRSNIPTYFAALCSVCNAKLVPNNFGQISITWDNPSAAIKHLETNSTVINGKFKYSSNDTEERYNHVTCTFSDRDQLGNTNMAVLQEQSLIDRNGIIPHDLVLQGCTRYSQALRKARYTFWVSAKDTSVITFNKLFGGLTYVAGELIKVLDSDMVSQTPLTAMIIAQQTSGANTILTLDTNVTLANEQYSIAAPATDGVTIIEHAISETNVATNVVTVTTNANFFIGAPIIFSATTISAKIFKVLGIKKSEESYEVMAVLHSMERYAYIESAEPVPLPEDSGMFGTFTQFNVDAVSNIQVSAFYTENNLRKSAILSVTWDYTEDFALKFRPQYGITYSRDGLPSVTQSGFFERSFDIHEAVPGNYKIQVWAINPISGAMSVSTILYYDYHSTAATSTLLPPTNAYVVGTMGQSWSGRDLQFYWVENSANVTATDKLSKYIVEIWNNANTSILQTISVLPNKENAETTGEFTLTLEHNVALFTNPNPTVNFKIFCEDLVGNRSTARAVTFTNPAPVVDAFTTTAGFGFVALKAVVNNYGDIVSFTYRKYASANSATALETATITANTYDFPATAGTEYWYTVQANDYYRSGTETTRSNATTVPIDADTYTYTGLQFTPNSPAANYVSWSSFNAIKNGATTVTVNAGNAQWTTGTLYLYYVPGDSTFKSTTSSSTAIAAGGRILATYKGGTDLTADAGKAFISGDQLIAGSLLSSALSAGTAYITSMAQMGNIIQSDNYSNSSGNYSGWRIDKQGAANFNSISVRDSLGNLIFSSGTGMEWDYVTGTNKPANNATVGADSSNLKTGTGKNLLSNSSIANNLDGWTYYAAANRPMQIFSRKLPSENGGLFPYGSILYEIGGASDGIFQNSLHGGNQTIPCSAGQRLEASAYVQVFRGEVRLEISFHDINHNYIGSQIVSGGLTSTSLSAVWSNKIQDFTRLWGFTTAPANACSAYIELRVANTGGNTDLYAGMFYLGYAGAGQTEPSIWDSGTPNGAFSTLNKIDSGNASTYIANAAIGSAQITDAAITNAKIDRASVNKLQVVTADIVDANVSTLKIAGNAVTVPYSFSTGALSVPDGGTVNDIISQTITSYGNITVFTLSCNILNSLSWNSSWGVYIDYDPLVFTVYVDDTAILSFTAWGASSVAKSMILSAGNHSIKVSVSSWAVGWSNTVSSVNLTILETRR